MRNINTLSSFFNKEIFRSLIGILIIVSLAFLNYRGILLSDQYIYSKSAYLLSQGNFSFTSTALEHRLGFIFPISIAIHTIGIKYMTFILWSLICQILFVLSIYWICKKYFPTISSWTALLLILNPLLVRQSSDILPDLPMACFATISMFFIYSWQTKKENNIKTISNALLTVLFMFLAFLSKELVFFLLPLILILLFKSIVNNTNYWLWVAGISVIIFGLYLYSYYLSTNNPFLRFEIIEGEHNLSKTWSYFGNDGIDIFYRLTLEPFDFLFSSPHFSYLVVLAIPSIGKKIENFPFLEHVNIYLVYLLAIHWFSSTSLQNFNPLPLTPRMWILTLPPLAVISSYTIKSLLFSGKSIDKKTKYILGIFFILVILQGWNKELLIPLYFIILIIFIQYLKKWKWLVSIAILLPLVGLQVAMIRKSFDSKVAFKTEEQVFRELDSMKQEIEIFTDTRMSSQYDVYFLFSPPTQIKVTNWENFSAQESKGYYILVNNTRKQAMEKTYQIHTPSYIEKITEIKKPFFKANNIRLWKINSSE